MIINNPTPYPLFKKGQQLKSSSLTGIVDFAGLEDQDTRVYLEGSGIFYGLRIEVDAAAGTLRLLPGTAVTSDGQLFSLENEIIYNGISKTAEGNDYEVPLLNRTATVRVLSNTNENHNEFAYRITGNDPGNPQREPDTTPYLVILIVRSDESTQDSCLYGYENSESKRTLEVEAALIERSFFTQAELDAWFINDTSEAGDKDPVINRFGYTSGEGGTYISFDRFTSWEAVSEGFDEVCAAAEPLIGDACKALYDLVKEKLGLIDPNNPFNNLAADLALLRQRVTSRNGKMFPWLYDYYRDLVATYQEFVSTDLFSYLSLIPKKDRFRGYIALGSIRTTVGDETVNYRMGLYRPPFADLGINALERPLLLMGRLKYLASVAHTRFDDQGQPAFDVRFTPDAGLNKLLSERAIPFYYNDPSALSQYWNAGLTRNQRTFTIPGITDDRDRKFLLANMDGYDFFRIKGHTGETIQTTIDAITNLRSELHLPFDLKIVYLGEEEDMQELILERSAAFSDLAIMLEKIVNDIRCARTCSDNFEESIFGERFDRYEIGSMFEALVTLFGPLPVEDLDKKLDELCNREGTCFDEDKTCCRAHLTSLYAVCVEYVRRKDELADSLLFHRFAKIHPGLEHNGGVPKGGTLVLVCARRNAALLSEEKKANLVNLILSSKQEEKAAGIDLAEELLNYEVVADFCLPYICCSSKPSINLIFQEAPPVARFSVAERTELPQGVGTRVTLKNLSLRADTYHWELYDFRGDMIQDEETTDLSEPVKFDLMIENGVVYTVLLTASREGMNSQYAEEITICPLSGVKLSVNDKDSIDWNIHSEEDLVIDATPYGGSFGLVFVEGESQTVIDPSGYDVSWHEDKRKVTLIVYDPNVGTYRLRYTFEDVDNCKAENGQLTIHTFSPTGRSVAPDTTTTPATTATTTSNDAALNKRIMGYRNGLKAMSKEDETLAEDSRWSDTRTFLLASGAPEELHTAYETLQATLQTGFSKLKAAQKAQVIRMLIYATAYYIDRLVVASPDKVPAVSKKLVKAAAESIVAQKDGISQWEQIWKTEGIATPENEKTLLTYKGLIA